MTLRLIDERIAKGVRSIAADRQVDAHTIAKAAGLTHSEMNDRLTGRAPFTVSELVQVGGLLHVPAGELLEGIA